MRKKFLSVFILTSIMIMASCDGSNDSLVDSQLSNTEENETNLVEHNSTNSEEGSSISEVTSTGLKEFSSNVIFEDSTVEYDGEEHSISVSDAPDFAEVTYTNPDSCVDVGSYEFEAEISAEGYETLNLTATLTITMADFTGLSFENVTYDFDSLSHSIELAGVLPENSSVVYTCAEDENISNEAVNPGTYTITATVTNDNYVTGIYTAKLIIRSNDEERYMFAEENGYLYFQNALDNNYLYRYKDGEVEKVNNDNAQYIDNYQDKITYVSHGLLSSSIKDINESQGTTDTLLTKNAKYLCNDGTNLYFALNGITNGKSGIYKADTFDGENEPTRIFEGKAKYLTYSDGYLYFADGTNGYKLTSLNLSNMMTTQLIDEKISDLEIEGDNLYYTVNNLILGDYIECYNLVSKEQLKITSDAGANLEYYNGYVYYVNVDLLTSNVFGDGIYRADADPFINNSLPGSRVVDALGDEGVCSLNIFSNGSLAYYDASDYGLYTTQIDGNNIEDFTNVLEGFDVPEYTPITMGGENISYNGDLYYLDIYHDKCLYKYNPITGERYKISANKVVNFDIVGDKLYFNQISYMVNNALYVIDLKQGGLPVKLSDNDCNDIVTDGEYIYYSEQNEAGVNTALHRMDLDGANDIVFYDEGCYNLVIVNDKLCFIEGTGKGYIEYVMIADIADGTILQPIKLNEDVKTTTFKVYGNEIYARKVGYIYKSFVKMDIDGNNEIEIMDGIDPKNFDIVNGIVYFYNEVATGTAGIYSMNVDGSDLTLILETGITYFPQDIVVIGDYLFFTNYILAVGGDSHTYQVDLSNGYIVTQIA